MPDTALRNAPSRITSLLLRYGGRTPTGLPFWRMVRAQDCRILCQGVIHHMPRGVDLDINTRPHRIQGGRFLMPRYRDVSDGWWVLERWFPPHVWGSAVDWRGFRTNEGDAPIFVQDFPSGGDYMRIAGPWPTPTDAGDLRAVISLYWRQQAANPATVESAVKMEMAREVFERQQTLEKLEREIGSAQSFQEQIWKSTSPAAQRYRDLMAAQAGVNGHMGASECWG